MPLKAAILVVSDTAFHDPSKDRSGAILYDTFAAEGNEQWIVQHTDIVPDDVLQIQSAVLRWCDDGNYVNLVVTTGGTGFAVMDCTPEAIGGLLHKQAPGLV
jgi:gephyrin